MTQEKLTGYAAKFAAARKKNSMDKQRVATTSSDDSPTRSTLYNSVQTAHTLPDEHSYYANQIGQTFPNNGYSAFDWNYNNNNYAAANYAGYPLQTGYPVFPQSFPVDGMLDFRFKLSSLSKET